MIISKSTNRIRQTLFCLIIAILSSMMFFLTACSSSKVTSKQPSTNTDQNADNIDEASLAVVSASQITDNILSFNFYTNMTKLSSEELPKHFNISTDHLDDYSVYISKDSNVSDCLAVFHTDSKDYISNVKAACVDAINQRQKAFLDVKSEAAKINSAVTKQIGCYYFLSINSNAKQALDSFQSALIPAK